MNFRYSIYSIIFFLIAGIIYAETFPPPPSGSDEGGTFSTYFQRIVASCDPGKAITGFETDTMNYGKPICAAFAATSGLGLWKTGDDGTSAVFTGGKVGIGTTRPTEALSVSGSITASGQISAYDPVASNHVVTLGYLNTALLSAAGGGGIGVYQADGTTRVGTLLGIWYLGNPNIPVEHGFIVADLSGTSLGFRPNWTNYNPRPLYYKQLDCTGPAYSGPRGVSIINAQGINWPQYSHNFGKGWVPHRLDDTDMNNCIETALSQKDPSTGACTNSSTDLGICANNGGAWEVSLGTNFCGKGVCKFK